MKITHVDFGADSTSIPQGDITRANAFLKDIRQEASIDRMMSHAEHLLEFTSFVRIEITCDRFQLIVT